LVFNSDDPDYGGTGFAVKKTAKAHEIPLHNQPYSVVLNVPPSSAIVLRGIASKTKKKGTEKKSKTSTTKSINSALPVKDTSTKSLVSKKKTETLPVVKDDTPKPVVNVKKTNTKSS
ncbi:MAG: alpha amylase C-terminal domain-containing protein, partial [Eubacterium sp.]